MDMETGLVEAIGSLPISTTLTGSLARAANYARDQAHASIALEHLLLALTEDPDAIRIMSLSGVDADRLATDVSNHLGRIEDHLPPGSDHAPEVSEELKRILKGAAAASRGRRREIDGAIVLAAIVGDAKSAAAHILSSQGLNFETAIRALQAVRDTAAAEEASEPHHRPPANQADYDAASDPHASPSPTHVPVTRPQQARPAANDIIAEARSKVQARNAPAPADDEPIARDREVLGRLEIARRAYEQRQNANGSEPPAGIDDRGNGRVAPGEHHDEGPDRSMARAAYRLPVSPPVASGRPMSPRPRPIPQPQERRTPPASELMAGREQRPAPRPPSAPPLRPGPGGPPPEHWPELPPSTPPRRHAPDHGAATPAAGFAPPESPKRVDHPQTATAQGAFVPQHPGTRPHPQAPPQPPLHVPPRPHEPVPHRNPAAGSPVPSQPGPPPTLHPRQPNAGPQQTEGPPFGGGPGRPSHPGPRPQPPPPGFRPIPPPRPAAGPPQGDPRFPQSAGAPPPHLGHDQAQHPGADRIAEHELASLIPPRMTANRTTLIEIELPRAKLAELNLSNAHPGVQTLDGASGSPMAVVLRLRAPEGGFFIEPISAETQWLGMGPGATAGPPVCWRWNVTPKRSGRFPIQVLIAGRSIGPDGLATETALPGQVAEVRIRGNVAPMLLGTAKVLTAFLLGAALVFFSGPIVDFATTAIETMNGTRP